MDAAHIGTARRLSLQHKLDEILLTINLGHSLYTRKGKTKITEVIRKCLGRFCHLVCVVRLTRANLHQRLEFFFTPQIVAIQLHTRDDKLVPFMDIDHQ